MDKCFTKINDKLYAIMNWRHRLRKDDVIITEELTGKQRRKYKEMAEKAFSERAIFDTLFPPENVDDTRVLIEVSQLTKSQLVYLVLNKLGLDLPSLKRMNRVDLEKLFGALTQRRAG